MKGLIPFAAIITVDALHQVILSTRAGMVWQPIVFHCNSFPSHSRVIPAYSHLTNCPSKPYHAQYPQVVCQAEKASERKAAERPVLSDREDFAPHSQIGPQEDDNTPGLHTRAEQRDQHTLRVRWCPESDRISLASHPEPDDL